MDQRVLTAMMPYFSDEFYNPSAAYLAARRVHDDIATARHSLAKIIGAKSAEIIITAGATESINLALNGVIRCWRLLGRVVAWSCQSIAWGRLIWNHCDRS